MLDWVLRNPHSDFYKRHLGLESIPDAITPEWWARVPTLPRPHIIMTPLQKRTHVPRKDVHFIRHTYGSSGNGVLITPRVCFGDYAHSVYQHLGMKRVMNFFASAGNDFPYLQTGLTSLQGNVADLALSARLIAKLEVNAIYLTPYTAILLADELEHLNVIDTITSVQLTGERCSPAQFAALKGRYKNAVVFGNYSSSEAREFVAVPCAHKFQSGETLHLTATPEWYLELVHPDTQEVITKPNEYGEIVLTTLLPTPFPFIRYATGDIAAYQQPACSCDTVQPAFAVQGRKEVLPIRMQRGEITIDNVTTALSQFVDIDTSYFEIHYAEETHGANVLPRISLYVHTHEAVQQNNVSKLAEAIASAITVYPNHSYQNGVNEGLYLPLRVLSVAQMPTLLTGKSMQPKIVRLIDATTGEMQVRQYRNQTRV